MDGRFCCIPGKVKEQGRALCVGKRLNQELGPSIYHTCIGDINDVHTAYRISCIRFNSNLKDKEYVEFMINFLTSTHAY